MNRPPACIFEVNEMGNKEFSWSGLKYWTAGKKPAITQGRQNQGNPRSKPDRHEMVLDVETKTDDPVT